MNYSLKIKLLELTQRALMVRADAQPDNGDKWRTTETGSKILLGKDGTVKGGMGGKFNGKNIKEVGGTKKFTKYQTNKEREQKNEPTAKREPAKPYAKNTDSVNKIMGSYDFGQAMHTTTLELADKIRLAESTLKGEKNGGTDKQKQSLSDFKQVLIDRLHSSHADDKKNEVERRLKSIRYLESAQNKLAPNSFASVNTSYQDWEKKEIEKKNKSDELQGFIDEQKDKIKREQAKQPTEPAKPVEVEKPTIKEKPKKPTVIKKMTGESTAKDIAKEFKKEGFHVTVDSPRSLKVTSPIYGVTAYYKKYSNSFGNSKWEMMEFNRKKPVYLNREDVHNNEYNEWMDKLNDVHKKMFPTEPAKPS